MTEKIFEYIIIGPPDIGKTSIMIRYLDNMFYDFSYNTIGVDMRTKKINNYRNEDGRINIYDTAGQERYFSITTNFIRNKDCIFLCFSLANLNSFNECKRYISYINNNKKDNACIFIVGTFLDMKNTCENINRDEIIDICKKNNYKYFEVSSKTGEGIRELFEISLNTLIERNLGTYQQTNFIVEKVNKCC